MFTYFIRLGLTPKLGMRSQQTDDITTVEPRDSNVPNGRRVMALHHYYDSSSIVDYLWKKLVLKI